VICVNDGAVMAAWAKAQKVEGSMITFLADPRAEFTTAMGMVLGHSGVMALLGNPRCKRYALSVVNGTVAHVAVSYSEEDPSGGDNPKDSCAENMLAHIA